MAAVLPDGPLEPDKADGPSSSFAKLRSNGHVNSHVDHNSSGSWHSSLDRKDSDPARINPFHLLSHPNTAAPLPDLPPHLQRLVDAEAELESHHRHGSDSGPDVPTLHIAKVTRNSVQMVHGPVEDVTRSRKIMKKVSNVFQRVPGGGNVATAKGMADMAGRPSASPNLGLPPSPPASDVEEDVEPSEDGTSVAVTEGDTIETRETMGSGAPATDEGAAPSLTPVRESGELGSLVTDFDTSSLFTSRLTAEPSELSPVTGQRDIATRYLGLPSDRRVSSSSTSSRAGSLSIVRSGRLAPQRDGPLLAPDMRDGVSSLSEAPYNLGKDLPLPPPLDDRPQQQTSLSSLPSPASLNAPQMRRRSTNPNSPSMSPSALARAPPLLHSKSSYVPSPTRSHSPLTPVPGLEGSALAPDIVAQAEEVRRERLERRAKKFSQGASGSGSGSGHARGDVISDVDQNATQQGIREPKRGATESEEKVLVGRLIGEDHVNYVLMYNMLTGIRIGAKIKRPITDEDYTARHKFSFDIIGNELTPSARYDFKFKDYAPWVFRELRDEHFHLDPADYLLSLTAKYILSELGSPGKSGSFFYFSRDYRFIIKTISHSEHKFLRSILKDYHEHVKTNPHTLLSRFYGLHRVKLPRGRKIHFVIMNNLFPPHRDIHETYDLKGSAFGREYPEAKAARNPRAVLKDKNWVNRGRTLELGPEKRALLSEQLRRDMDFLKRMRVMDYSLLVGIHNMERGNTDNLRQHHLKMINPEMPIRRKPSSVKGPSEASELRRAVRGADKKQLDASLLPATDSADRRHFLFYQDEGGLRATDEQNRDMDMIYYLGVIDICTPYNSFKKVEHFWKSMTENAQTISCVDPATYGQRFLNFLLSVMRGGDVSLRPAGLMPEPAHADDKPVGQVTGAAERLEEARLEKAERAEAEADERDLNASVAGHEEREPSSGGEAPRAMVGHLKAE